MLRQWQPRKVKRPSSYGTLASAVHGEGAPASAASPRAGVGAAAAKHDTAHHIVQFFIERVDPGGSGLCATLTVCDLAGHKPIGGIRSKHDTKIQNSLVGGPTMTPNSPQPLPFTLSVPTPTAWRWQDGP